MNADLEGMEKEAESEFFFLLLTLQIWITYNFFAKSLFYHMCLATQGRWPVLRYRMQSHVSLTMTSTKRMTSRQMTQTMVLLLAHILGEYYLRHMEVWKIKFKITFLGWMMYEEEEIYWSIQVLF